MQHIFSGSGFISGTVAFELATVPPWGAPLTSGYVASVAPGWGARVGRIALRLIGAAFVVVWLGHEATAQPYLWHPHGPDTTIMISDPPYPPIVASGAMASGFLYPRRG